MIAVCQNEKQQLEKLAAMRQMYSSAKKLIAVQWWFGIPFSVVLGVVVTFMPAVKVWSVFLGLTLALIVEFGFEPLIKSRTKLAAQIQELFDCKVLNLTWNKYHCGNEPDVEDICSASKRYLKRWGSFARLANWYSPEVEKVPLPLARLICQQSNLRWDVELRRRYRAAIYKAVAALIFILLASALAGHQSLNDLILQVLGASSPALLWGIKEGHKQSTSIEGLTSLKTTEDRVWRDSLCESNEEIITMAAREVQNAIFLQRKSNPLIFDFFYWIFKDKQEDELAARASHRVEEVLARRNT